MIDVRGEFLDKVTMMEIMVAAPQNSGMHTHAHAHVRVHTHTRNRRSFAAWLCLLYFAVPEAFCLNFIYTIYTIYTYFICTYIHAYI